ncbi:MAG TPA: serine/threonine-protein kinase [Gemmatimonadaceae bacterium]|nr:serine/threonine-protein kinase [Gemmatimonadaceae bacterium]
MTTAPPDHLARLQAALAGGYTLERELGGGGMSRVFVAMDHGLGRRVVVKVLLPELAASLSVERFRREVLLAAGLQHPNIVPVLTAGDAAGLPYFIMPFVDGESLRERMVRGPLSVRETVNIAKDVARALAFAHGRGIVHRDIKPGNILLCAGAAFVTDFGVAKALSVAHRDIGSGGDVRRAAGGRTLGALTVAGTSLGTPAYMAPEQAAADPQVDHRADIYALGIVMFEMLAGTLPFHGRTPQALLTAQLSEPPPPIATRRYDVPQPLADVLARCLEKDPARRPKSAGDLLRALDDPGVLSGAFAVLPTTRRRWRRTLLAALAAGVVAATALGWWVVARGREPAPAATVATTAPAPARSVAVVPLTAAGGDERARAVADGLTAQLTSALAGVPALRVASAPAAVRDDSAATAETPAELAQRLGVTLLVEGTVQRDGERLRVVLRLVDPASDAVRWSQSFDAPPGGALEMQDAAAQALVTAFLSGAAGQP